MRAALFSMVVLGGCNFTEFDNLSDQAWAQAADTPSIGSTDYGLVMFGTTVDASGGEVSVISNAAPNYSTLTLAAKGGSPAVGKNVRLPGQQINTLTLPPIYASSGAGDCAVVGTDSDSAVAYSACALNPSSLSFAMEASKVTAAGYVGKNLVISTNDAPDQLLLVVKADGSKCWCDSGTAIAAFAGGDMTGLAWTNSGDLVQFTADLTDPSICVPVTTMKPTTPTCAPSGTAIATGITPDAFASLTKVGTLAVVASSTQVGVIDMTAMAAVGAPLDISGSKSLAVGPLGSAGKTYVAVGYPDRAPGGAVDVLEVNGTTGIATSPAATLADAQPDSGQKFGHSVANVKYNGGNILVVSTAKELFVYYRTLLYPDARQQ
jgi:hypothetical protein